MQNYYYFLSFSYYIISYNLITNSSLYMVVDQINANFVYCITFIDVVGIQTYIGIIISEVEGRPYTMNHNVLDSMRYLQLKISKKIG